MSALDPERQPRNTELWRSGLGRLHSPTTRTRGLHGKRRILPPSYIRGCKACTVSFVLLWLRVGSEMEETVASYHQRCYLNFIRILTSLEQPDHRFSNSISLLDASNEFDRYKLWCGNIGAAHEGQNYRISLDYRLREAPFWKEQICSILNRLAETVRASKS